MSKFLERETCGRCGGSGTYSFNQIDGDRCYGCGGSGVRLTKRGAVARAFLIEQQSRPIEDVKAGEFVWYDPFPLGGKAGWAVVGEIKQDELNPGHVVSKLSRRGKVVCNYGFVKGQKVRSIRNQEHLDETLAAAEEYQKTLGVNGKQLKRLKEAA